MKIVIVNPLWSFRNRPPINLAELAGYIREYGHFNVSIVDLNYELKKYIILDNMIEKAVEIVRAQKPDIIGLTCNTIHVPFCVEFCRAYKRKYKIPIVLGGMHPTFRPDRMFKLSGVDYIVRGEGEETFLELLNTISQKGEINKIRGLSYRYKNKIYHNPDRPLIKDLSKLPFPAYDLLLPYVHKIRQENEKKDRIFEPYICASRGCPYGCIFCSSNRMWRYQRRKPIERIVEEIKYLKTKYKCSYIEFWDDCLPLNKAWFNGLLCELKKLKIIWFCSSRIDVLDYNLLRRMKDAGCNAIYHGLESGSIRIRKLLNKKLKPKVNNNVIAELVKKEIRIGIKTTCSFMVGVPTETEEEIHETIDFACELKKIGAIIQFWIMTPYPDIKAVTLYKENLIKFDRWKILRQSDINHYDQFYLYAKFYERYYKENPDFYMFKPNMEIKDFLKIYREGRQKLKMEAYSGSRLYNYIKEKGDKKYFIGIERKIRLDNINNIKGKAFFIAIQNNNFFNFSKKLVEKLKNLKPKNCFISVRIKKNDFCRSKINILRFIRNLKNNNIKFTITKPMPLVDVSDQRLSSIIPKNCADCYELFKVNSNGEIELCTGRKLCKEHYVYNRSSIYNSFIKLGILELGLRRTKSLCPNLPKDKKSFQLIQKRYYKGIDYIDWAEKYFSAGNIKQCIKYINKAQRLDCGQDRIHLLLGLCYERNKKYNKAITELKIAEKMYPLNIQINISLLKCYRNIEETRKSAGELLKVYRKLKNS